MASGLEQITKTLLSGDTLKGIAKASGIDAKDVSKVLSSALPNLIQGASEQSKSSKTKDSFASALESHGSKDITDLTSFFKNVDIDDGAKIVQHLLGGNSSTVQKSAAKASGVDGEKVASVMAAAAPLLMSVIGKNTQENKKKDSKSSTASLASALLENVDVGSILKGFLK